MFSLLMLELEILTAYRSMFTNASRKQGTLLCEELRMTG